MPRKQKELKLRCLCSEKQVMKEKELKFEEQGRIPEGGARIGVEMKNQMKRQTSGHDWAHPLN